MIKSKKGIELSVNFLVTLILAIVVFGMGIYLSTIIFGGGASLAEKKFQDFDREVGELACYASDNVCVHIKSEMINRGNLKTLAVTVKNVLPKKQFRLVVQNLRMVDQAGETKTTGFDKLLLYGLEEGRIETLEKGEKKTLGIGVEVPKTAISGQYVLDITVYYADPDKVPAEWAPYIERPYKIYITVP